MHEFAEEYVANLAARDERYDTRLGDDFYVGTFPNGVKTWIYVYEVDGYTRRQTLGVYPEMPLASALESLYAARRTRAVENDLMEQGIGGAATRQAEDSPIDLAAAATRRRLSPEFFDRRFVVGAAAGFALAAVAGVASMPVWMPLVMPAPPAASTASVPHEPAVAALPAVTALPVVAAPPAAEEAAVAPATAASVEPQAGPSRGDAQLSISEQAVIELQRDLSGTLAWGQLTSAIAGGEPVDDLGWIVEISGESREVFYFVRVRGMAGDDIVYRWLHEGKLVQQDTVHVSGGWHAPAFASVTVDPSRIGHWRVEVLGPDNRQLGVEQFETRVAAEVLSRR